MTTLAQPGLDEDKSVLQAIARHNRRDFAGYGDFACLGGYADVTQLGSVHVGDTIDLLPWQLMPINASSAKVRTGHPNGPRA